MMERWSTNGVFVWPTADAEFIAQHGERFGFCPVDDHGRTGTPQAHERCGLIVRAVNALLEREAP